MFFLSLLIFLSCSLALISLIYNKKYLLSFLLALELALLNILILNTLLSTNAHSGPNLSFSLFILTLAAIEGGIGIALLSLITRNFNTNNFNVLNSLKN